MKKRTVESFVFALRSDLDLFYICCLRAFWTIVDIIFNSLILIQCFETIYLNS